MKKQSIMNKKWMKKQKSKGLCIFCKRRSMPNNDMCEYHYVRGMVRRNLGSLDNFEVAWELFDIQGRRCYYTGTPLVLGENASIDHRDPQDIPFNTRDDKYNIVWCTKTINRLKNNMSEDEFIGMCYLIAERHRKRKVA